MLQLVYVGKVIQIDVIPEAQNVELATVVCGSGGKWRGVVRKANLSVGDLVEVYLPDTVVDKTDPAMDFMEVANWRVKMRKFLGVPSEVLILPLRERFSSIELGHDISLLCKVERYVKALPPGKSGETLGQFPYFIPRTDEVNFQGVLNAVVTDLIGRDCYWTVKYDGTSTTAYHRDGKFGYCTRNWELKRPIDGKSNLYWQAVKKYHLDVSLPKLGNIAVQFETVGPGIQKNTAGFKEIDGRLFDVYFIDEHRYANLAELQFAADVLRMPMVDVVYEGIFHPDDDICSYLQSNAEGIYPLSGKQREGIVVRSSTGSRISFKVINLNYKD